MKALAVDYSVLQLISKGIVVDHITLTAPDVRLARDASGWNIGRLIKPRAREADREGPARSVSLPSIAIVDGAVSIDDKLGSTSYRLPRRFDDLDVQATFAYEPVHFSIGLDKVSFRAAEPELTMQQLTGAIAVRDDNLYFERMVIRTGESALNLGGVIESYLRTPVIKLVSDGNVSLPEVGRIVPALEGYQLHPALTVKTAGTIDRLLMDLDLKTEAGLLRGPLTTDLSSPDFSFAGPFHVEHLNLGPILKSPSERSDITGDVTIDLKLPSNPATTPVFERLGGTFAFSGPRVRAFGYEAAQVRARGAFKGPRIALAQASASAYGGSATARGVIVLPQGRRPIAIDLQGTANKVDMRRLPASTRAPKLDTILSLADYHVKGSGTNISGTVTLNQSLVEGAMIGPGTTGEFDFGAKPMTYAARGTMVGLDVRRLGNALQIASLDDPRYAGRVSGDFDLKAAGTSLAELDLAASGTIQDSTMWGTHVPEMTFKSEIVNSSLTVYAKGGFNQLDPGVILERKDVAGNVSGNVDATLRIADLSQPVTASSVAVDGKVTLAPSLLGSIQIVAADVEGKYAGEVADITKLHVDGPDVTLDASGRLALGGDASSDLKYHVNATDITELGRITGQANIDGTLVLDGTITGTSAALETKGTLSGNGLAYGENKILDVDSDYTVTVRDQDFANAHVEAKSRATFVELGGVELNEVVATTTYADKRLEFETTVQERERNLAATGSVIFHPDHHELHLPNLALVAQGVEWRNVPGSDAAIQYRPNEITIKDLRLASGDQTLDVEGALGLDSSGTTGELQVKAVNVDLTQMEKLLLQNRGFSGRLTANAKISGRLNDPSVDGHVEITGGGFQDYKYESLKADVDYGGKRITLDALLQQQAGISISAKGTVPTTAFQPAAGEHVASSSEDSIDVRIQTQGLNLGVVQGFTTAITQVGGTLQADVKVTGSGRDPHLVGFVEVKDGAFSVPRFGTSYSGLDTRIDLEPDVVRVRRFEIIDEEGEQLAVAGQLAVHQRQVGAVDFTLESQNFEIIDNELGDIGVGVALKVTGELSRPKLEGDVRIASGRLEVDRILQLFYDPYRTEALPEVVSAERTVREVRQCRGGNAEGPGTRREGRDRAGGAAAGGEARAAAAKRLRERLPRRARQDSRRPRRAGEALAAGRTDARCDRRHQHHARRRPRRAQGRGRARHGGGDCEHGARDLSVPGPSVRHRPQWHPALHRRRRIQSGARPHRDARDS